MVCRLIDFAVVVLELLVFKVCRITGISKIEFHIFPVLKGLNKTKKIKNHSKPPRLVSQSLFKQFQQISNIFLVFH